MEVHVGAAVWVLLLCCLTFPAVKADSGLLLTFPKSALYGSPVKICFTSKGLEGEISVTVSARTVTTRSGSCDGDQVRWTGSERDMCLDVPTNCSVHESHPQKPHGSVTLHPALFVDGITAAGEVFRRTYRQNIPVRDPPVKTFIQTDKPTYQPGQKVLFRVLTVSYPDMLPGANVESVWVSSPSGTRMKQWGQGLDRSSLLLDLDFLLSSEPELGTWVIHVRRRDGKDTTQTFSVKEYVLPKFEVNIVPPSYLYKEHEGNFTVKVCAKYTYGQPVRGSVAANVSLVGEHVYRWRPVFTVRTLSFEQDASDSSGCADITVPASRQGFADSHVYQRRNMKLNVEANFTESGTGVSLHASSSSCRITDNDYEMVLRGPDTFKPGMEYRGEVHVTRPDGSPLPNKSVNVLWNGESREQQQFVTGTNGVAPFGLRVPFDPLVTTRTLKAIPIRSQVYSSSRVTARKTLKSWYSPSTSFLDASTTRQRVIPRQLVPIWLQFTLPSSESIAQIQFFYRVVSRGRIVSSGKETWNRQSTEGGMGVGVGVDLEVEARSSTPVRRTRGARLTRSSWYNYQRRIPHTQAPDLAPYQNVSLGQMQFNIEATPAMSPISQVLVYYIRSDGEVVSATTTFEMAPAFDNRVSLEIMEGGEVRPGHSVSIAVTADPHSQCAVAVVDKSVHIMGGNNQLTKSKVFAPVADLNGNLGSTNTSCPTQASTYEVSTSTKHVDAAEAFRKSGLDFTADFNIETRPCWITTYTEAPQPPYCGPYGCIMYRMPMMLSPNGMPGAPAPKGPRRRGGVMFDNGGAQEIHRAIMIPSPIAEEEAVPEPLVELRNYFPETWLWKLTPTGPNGRHVIQEDIPHTITDWVASTFCLSADRGIGVADSTSVRAFQPFFLSYTLPYSVIRGEKVPVKVTVFNYLTTCLNIELSLSESTNFAIEARPESEIVEVCGNSAETLEYEIVPFELGDVAIRVDALAQPPSHRGDIPNNVFTSPLTDAIEDTILVEAEGAEREETFSDLICPSSNVDNLYWSNVPLRLPSLVVPGSARGRIQVIGDVMGPAMSNLDSLLRMPFGCGEQNMIFMAPNIYVMQYLSQTNQLTSEIEEKALNFMSSGYQRELQFQLRDGSFSAFGERDGEGSTWLTAFVLKSFIEAKDFMEIDESNLERTARWLLRNPRDANGCVVKQGRVIHKEMQGAVSSPVTLTAFVTIALLEAGSSPEAVNQGMRCITHWLQNTPDELLDTYSLAISSYALGLWGDTGNQASALFMLEERMQGDADLHYWSNSDVSEREDTVCIDHCPAPSSDIEVTSYALLAYLSQPQREFSDLYREVMPIVKWLNTQRNGLGGFSSTQDTVLGLQALSTFAQLLFDPTTPVSLEISVNATRPSFSSSTDGFQEHSFLVTNDNRLVLQREQLAEVPTDLTVTGVGSGCALFQAELRYNMPLLAPNRLLFDIGVQVIELEGNTVSDPAACGDKTVRICVRYTGRGEETNMAVIEVKMVSGYIPHEESLERFQMEQGNSIGLKRIDKYEKGKPLALYFDQFDATDRCVPITMKQEIIVKEAKDAVIKVYDYYKPGVVGFKGYNTCENQE